MTTNERAADLTAGLLISVGIRRWALDTRYIFSPSMEPTLEVGDRFVLDKLSLRWRPPERGEVVCFRAPPPLSREYGEKACFVKRVVAVGGDKVQVRRGALYVNGARVREEYLRSPTSYAMPRLVVPQGHLFVLGDNRADSRDSHFWGPLQSSYVLGRAIGEA